MVVMGDMTMYDDEAFYVGLVTSDLTHYLMLEILGRPGWLPGAVASRSFALTV